MGGEPAAADSALPAVSSSWSAPWHSAPTPGVQRQAGDVTEIAEPGYSPAPAAGGSQTSAQPGAPGASAQGSGSDDGLGPHKDKLIELSKRRPLDLDDPADIDELSVRIYQRIHRRLRRDLVVDRERAGRLGETGPFGTAR
jgi:hypothetical protein